MHEVVVDNSHEIEERLLLAEDPGKTDHDYFAQEEIPMHLATLLQPSGPRLIWVEEIPTSSRPWLLQPPRRSLLTCASQYLFLYFMYVFHMEVEGILVLFAWQL